MLKDAGIILENESLLIEINTWGAELARIYDKKNHREVLWEGKPEIWGRHSPILFPFIAKSFEGKYRYEGKTWDITPHGFARDMEFSLLSHTDSEVWFGLSDSSETHKMYPFCFNLELGFRLKENRITVLWKVINRDEKEMLFMIGGHPAFKTPEGSTIYDFTFDFHGKDMLHYLAPNDKGYEEAGLSGMLKLENGRVPLTKGFFDTALTYMFDDGQVEKVSLLLPGGKPYVTVSCKGIPYFGIWTMEKTHPFVCLEPWCGICDKQDYDGELAGRMGIQKLGSNQIFEREYEIEVH